jgi:hypothetical protein
VDDLEGLLGLVEMDAVELHPWAATVEDIEHPDRLVFDLDPGPGIQWAFAVETALILRDVLEEEGYESWPKLTGGKGLHLMVPIEPSISHDEAREYCRGIAERIARTAPERYTTSPDPKQRRGRITSIICGTAAGTLRSARTRHAPVQDFRSRRRSRGAMSNAACRLTLSRLSGFQSQRIREAQDNHRERRIQAPIADSLPGGYRGNSTERAAVGFTKPEERRKRHSS